MSRMLQNLGRPPSVSLLFVPQEKESHGQAGLAKPWPLSGSLLFDTITNKLQSPRSKMFSTWYTSYLHILLLNFFLFI